MKTRRDRWQIRTYLVLAAALVFTLFGAPVAQEMDTGPQLAAFELVNSPEAMVLIATFEAAVAIAESESLFNVHYADVELTGIPALASPTEHARHESGHRSGVGMHSHAAASFYSDLERLVGRPRVRPLRC